LLGGDLLSPALALDGNGGACLGGEKRKIVYSPGRQGRKPGGPAERFAFSEISFEEEGERQTAFGREGGKKFEFLF